MHDGDFSQESEEEKSSYSLITESSSHNLPAESFEPHDSPEISQGILIKEGEYVY